jgi:uncharacterized protein (TIGR03118 family)
MRGAGLDWRRFAAPWVAACLALGCTEDLELSYATESLVSNVPGRARTTDPLLVSPWGLAAGPSSPFWVVNGGSETATVYDGNGLPQPPDAPRAVRGPGLPTEPTGAVFDFTEAFAVPGDDGPAPSPLVVVGRDGRISAVRTDVDPPEAVVVRDASAAGADYTGVALADDPTLGPLLYVANFGAGRVEVYRDDLSAAKLAPRAFVDPELPVGYAPFGVRALGTFIWVTYALRQESAEVRTGLGNGIVSVFSSDGTFQRRFHTGGELDAPWSVDQVPPSFIDEDDCAVVVGNLGDGRILVFDTASGELLGPLTDDDGNPIVIDGLRALRFGRGAPAGDVGTLYFTAATEGGAGGLFGAIAPTP